MMDYRKLIDNEIWAFIERTENHYPPDAASRTITEQRSFYHNLCTDFSAGYPNGVVSTDATVDTDTYSVPVRRYSAENEQHSDRALIVFMHGGGYVLGNLHSHDDVCAELCAYTGFNLTAIDYRLAPEHKHPSAFEDCLAVVRHEAARLNQPIVLCGDSAGGNLCAAVAHQLRNDSTRSADAVSPVVGQILLYPELGGDKQTGSYSEHANAPMLTLDDVMYYQNIRFANENVNIDFTNAPLQDTSFANLPKTLVVSAACDPLSDDGKHYCDAINQAGGSAQWKNEAGLVHGFVRARHSSEKARRSFQLVIDTLKRFATEA